MASLRIQVRLGGHPTTTGSLDAIERPTGQRASEAVGTFALAAGVAAVAVFIPPHVPWVVVAVSAGTLYSYKRWRSLYRVERFAAPCPRCGSALAIPPGEGIRLPLKVTCFSCHHEPVVSLEA